MEFRTPVSIEPSKWHISPCETMLFVGSCFADNMGRRLKEDMFRVTANPYGVMYNPASILHTIERFVSEEGSVPQTVVMTLGTSRVYILNSTGEIVDNCRKRPQRLFTERELSVGECADYLSRAIRLLRERRPDVRVILTVSPIRYAKYGFHGSNLSKAKLLLAADQLASEDMCTYFPAYEIVCDELRDYRFYAADMLHPSEQAVDYIQERFAATFFSPQTADFLRKWRPLKAALAHRPFNPDSDDYRDFLRRTREKIAALMTEYPDMPSPYADKKTELIE